MSDPTSQPPPPASDREIVHGRLVSASPAEVLRAFTDGDRLARWWGPAGFSNDFQVFEPRPGGPWRFDMIGPDGKRYRNESRFLEVGPERVVIRHENAPHFVLTVGLAAEGGKTRVSWRGLFETAELLEQLRPMITPANEQNLDRLEAELARKR